MTIKTEQLRHSLDELDAHIKKLNEFPRNEPTNTIIVVRELMQEISDSTLDCFVIISSILADIT